MKLKILAAALSTTLALPAFAIGHLADLRIHDRSTGQELPVHWHQGQAYVVGNPGNEYSVSLRNRKGEDVLAVVSVDGVNVVSGQTADTHQGGYVLAPRRSLDIKGWRKSLNHTAAFYFTSLGDSYAARTGRPDNVGVIGVALFRRAYEPPQGVYDPHPAYPRSEMKREREGAPAESAAADSAAPPSVGSAKRHSAPSTGAPLGTGHGRNETSHARHVQFERASDHPAEVITIRYDSYRNLVAQGVIHSRYGRSEPQPFPGGFVPDPAGYARYR